MSHYNDQSGYQSCLQCNSYSRLEDTTKFNCDLPCLCRFNVDERSAKDKMYYNWFVLDQPINIPTKEGESLKNPYNNISRGK